MRFHRPMLIIGAAAMLAVAPLSAIGDEKQADPKPADPNVAAVSGGSTSAASSGGSSAAAPKHASYLKDTKKVDGLIPLHYSDQKLFAELSSSHYGSEYIVLISIARGIGQGSLLGGMSWGFGDDWVWQFRKIGDKVHIIRKNVRFKATKGSPEASAVQNAYTDSVLFSLPIITKGPKGGDLIDLSPVFFSDLPQISSSLPGFSFSASKSTWAEVKGFEKNVELEVAATYASSGRLELDTVPDSRGATINVHYSISKIPSNGYTPRLADDRVGYFITAVKDFSNKSDRENFVRYVNRWDLKKADSSADMSPPKEPLIFWMEKTIPYKYRKAIRDGILEWNKAFEAAGFIDAIEVRQQPDDADWDPEDINYNTFRWITSNAGFAMGPSRVNPYTGQILDADIIFDADFLTYWKSEFDTFTPDDVAAMTGGPLERNGKTNVTEVARNYGFQGLNECMLSRGMSREFALGVATIMADPDPSVRDKNREKLIMQGLKEVTMHEVGHTLGLRHNFKASRYLTLEEMNDPDKAKNGIVASVMDYNPVNMMPKGKKQGDYYSQTVGPYDIWAIEYGYKPLSGGTTGEKAELDKIAAKSGKHEYTYATDEDTRGSDPDPYSNRFDLGKNPAEYAKIRSELVKQVMPGLIDRMTEKGDDYLEVRRAFNVLLAAQGQSSYFVARQVGGLVLSRSHKGDEGAAPPVAVVDAEKQREAMKYIAENVLKSEAWTFDPEILNHLAKYNWRHWGTGGPASPDFAVHDYVLSWQDRILSVMLSSTNLSRLHDAQLRVPADEDVFTTGELIEGLTASIFSELDDIKGEYTNRKPAIDSMRRNLQRTFLDRLSNLALGRTFAPEDCEAVAYAELVSLNEKIDKVLKGKAKLDSLTKAHLIDTSAKIDRILEARVATSGI